MRGWQGQPRKMVEYEHCKKNKPGCRSPGCRLQFDGAEKRPSAITVQSFKTPFGVRRTSNSTALFLSTGNSDARHFILNGAVRNSALAPSRCMH
jgi:hypothetical protein